MNCCFKVYTLDNCNASPSPYATAESKICTNYLDVTTFLSYVSFDDYDNFCLGFTFTSRDFNDGSLGLAYLGSTNGDAGGICEKQYNFNGVSQNLNCGMVTLVSYGSRVPDLVVGITFAHEVGHSFGAPHDSSSCQPGDRAGGNFIMYPFSTSGTFANNIKFSSCSLSAMGLVVNYVVTGAKFCFESNFVSSLRAPFAVEFLFLKVENSKAGKHRERDDFAKMLKC